MRIIIAGGRDFNDFNLLDEKCIGTFKQLKNEGFATKRENIEIVSGTAKGADKLGEELGKVYNLTIKRFPADWDQYGKAAGYIRNEDMAKYAKDDKEIGVLIAFWDGKSRGTKHMINLANKHGLRVFVVNY